MIECEEFAQACLDRGFEFFTGVPDSTYKSWMTYIGDEGSPIKNVTTTTEGEAIAVASGYHLGTDNVGVVYMQVDGLGNCVNPLTSLTNEEVYRIPMILMIGWRSEPGIDDAVQHDKMGEILPELLDLLDIPYEVLPTERSEYERVLDEAASYVDQESKPFALVVRHDTFESDTAENIGGPGELTREEAVKHVADAVPEDGAVVSTTGKLSRELYEHRKRSGDGLGTDSYNVGAMGSTQSIGLGLAIGSDRPVAVFDGDGSLLMRFGAQVTNGHQNRSNFHHFVFDNETHESTGGQATASPTADFAAVAEDCGYRHAETAETAEEIELAVIKAFDRDGPTMTVLKVRRDSRPDLGRPDESPQELKRMFMERTIE